MTRTALVHASSGPTLGAGHVMRCLALARGLALRGWRVRWRGELVPALARRVAEVAQVVDGGLVPPKPTVDDAGAAAEWVILDVPGVEPATVRREGARLLLLADVPRGRLDADLVVNPNACAEELPHDLAPGARLLAGGAFVLLRAEFARAPEAPRQEGRRLLLGFGGADPPGLTLRALEALRRAPSPPDEVVVLAGCANPRLDEVRRAAGSIDARVVVDTDDVAGFMARADVAIVPGGVTVHECMAAGLPCVFLPLGPDQAAFLARHAARGFGAPAALETLAEVTRALLASAPRRAAMAAAGRALVDGRGVERVIAAIEEHAA